MIYFRRDNKIKLKTKFQFNRKKFAYSLRFWAKLKYF
jgi:hypothetical protein